MSKKWRMFFCGFGVAGNLAFLLDDLLKKGTYGLLINRPIDISVEVLVVAGCLLTVIAEER